MADRRRRVVVEVSLEVHRELRKTALLNDLKVYELADALLAESLKDQENVKVTLKRLKSLRNPP